MQVHKNSLPIALDKKYTTDKRIIFMPSENPPDDPSGSVLFTKHGFFEIPKEKNQPAKFVSKREFIMESYYKDVFSKLPFLANFRTRKILAKWMKETRKAHYSRCRRNLKESLWVSDKIFAQTYPRIMDSCWSILNINGIEMRENTLYGKRHIEFNQRQQVCLNEVNKVYEASTHKIISVMEDVTKTLRQSHEKEREELKNEQITEKLETRKDHFIGIEKKKRGKARTRELRYEFLKLQEKLNDYYLKYIRLRYIGTIVEMLEKNFCHIANLLCSQHKPKFELILMIKDSLFLEPDLEKKKKIILTCASNLMQTILTNKYMLKFENFFTDYLFLKPAHKSSFTQIIELALSSTGRFKQYEQSIEKEINKDIDACFKFIQQYKHLEGIKNVGVTWLNQLKEKTFDVVSFYKDNYEQFNKFSVKIDEIPTVNFSSGILTIETATIRNSLQEIPKGVISSLKERLLEIITFESSELKNELFTHHALLEEKASTLPQFVEQVMSTSVLKQTKLKEWEKKIVFVTECVNLCRKENVRIPANTSMAIDECKSIVKNLPAQIAKAEVHYQEYRNHFESQMQRGSSQLSKKIQKFQAKYIERYMQETDRLAHTAASLKEIEKREEALSAMKQRVELYEDFNNALACIRPPGEAKQQVQCREEFKATFDMHCDTVKLWKLANYWKEHLEGWLSSTFLKLQVPKMFKKIDTILSKLKISCFSSKLFIKNSERIMQILLDEIEEISSMRETLTILKDDVLKPRHWELIFKIIKKPHFMNIPFKLQDLKEAALQKFANKIQHLFKEAKEESKQESSLLSIKSTWESLDFIAEAYRERMDTFVIKNFQEVHYAIEEHLAIIENIEKTQYSEHIQPEIDDWRSKLAQMRKVLEYWIDAQEAWSQLEPIFTSGHMQETFLQEHEAFNDIQANFRRIMWSTFHSPKVALNLLVPNRENILLSILEGLGRLRKNIKSFLETRRVNFPRFFFLSDPQLLEFLSKIHSREKYDKHISVIFPGCSRFYVKQINPWIFATEEDPDTDKLPFNSFTPAVGDLLGPFEFSEASVSHEAGSHVLSNSNLVVKQQNLIEKYPESSDLGGMHPFEILGMFGFNEELFFFEKSVGIHEGVEGWIGEVEKQMKESLSKMINFAVSTFPKQSLDEWVLDYPQQVIFTAINLILTHEITELMEENAKEAGSNSDESFDDSENIPEDYEEHFSKVYFGSLAQTKSMGQSKLDMMKILQSKNYRGLFLRLQFWINQITKSIQADQETKQRMTQLHLMSLRSLVFFLCYQREIVGNLLEKKIFSNEDFEWQKHFRVYWKADENMTKIECGGLHLVQNCEYLGTGYRLLCTPLTTKYFLFMSCAIRESSSVLFKTNSSHQCAGDVFEEFANWCGMGSKRIVVNAGTATSSLMQVLNGAALANFWVLFEHISKLNLADLQIIIKEIQMVQQQFLISVGGDSQGESTINKSSRSGASEQSSRQVKVPLKSVNSLFVVMCSIDPFLEVNSNLLTTLSNTFRCTEMIRPDYKTTSSFMLIREGFRYHQGLSRTLADLCRNLVEKLDLQLSISTRDIMTVITIAKKFRDAIIADNDLEMGETQSLAKACKLYFFPKLLHIKGGFDKESEKFMYDAVDDSVAFVFRKRQRGGYELGELRKGLEQAFAPLKLTVQEHLIRAAEDVYYGLRMHRAVLLLGEKASGKSTVLSLLSAAMKSLYELQVNKYILNPNVFTPKQLFGSLNSEKVQRPGILASIIENAVNENFEFNAKWLILESEKLKPWWVESFLQFIDQSPLLNSESYTLEPWEMCLSQKTLNDSFNNFLVLPNLIHLRIPKDMQVIFESCSPESISPALFTKVSTHYIRENYVNWDCYLVPASKELSEKFIKYGLLSQWILDIFNEKIRSFIIKLHKQFKSIDIWNTKSITLAYCRFLTSVIELGVVPHTRPLGEAEGLFSPSFQEIYDYAVKYGNTHQGILELKARLELGLIFALVWTYGAILSEDEKKIFNNLFGKHFSGLRGKYYYPDDIEIFDNYVDWEGLTFFPIFTEFSVYGLTSPQPSEVLVPSLLISRCYFLCKQTLTSTATHQPSLMHIHLFGPVASGKSSIAKIMTAAYAEQSIYKNYDSTFSLHQITKLIAIKSSFKVTSSEVDKKILVVVEDVNLDSKQELAEGLRYFVKQAGYYDPKDLSFKSCKDINFITTDRDILKSSGQHMFYCECPENSLFKQALINYVYLRPNPIDMLIHRYLKLITSIINNIRAEFKDEPAFSFPRTLRNFKTLLFFTNNCELFPEPELKEEERVSEILIYEVFRGFKDGIRDKKPVELKLLEIVNRKLKIVKESIDFMYGNYAQEEAAYNLMTPFTRQPASKYRDLQNFIIETSMKTTLQSEDNTLTISANCLHSSSLEYIWAFCRILQGEGLHGIVEVPVGQGAYECLQLACMLKKNRLSEPFTQVFNDFPRFRDHLESSLYNVIEGVRKGHEWVPCLFLCMFSHIKCERSWDHLISFVTSEDLDSRFFSEAFIERLSQLEKRKIQLASVSVKDEDPIKQAIQLGRRHFRVMVMVNSTEEFEKFQLKYPRFVERSEVVLDVAHNDFTETSNMIERYLAYRELEPAMADIITELFMYIRGVFERKEYYISLDHSPIETTPISTFMCNKRIILFVDLLALIINTRTEKLRDYKQSVESMVNKTKRFQKLHSQLENNMTSLQDFSMRTSSNIASIKTQIEKIRKNQQTKNQLIEEKEKINSKLQEELEIMQKENEVMLSNKTMKLQETMGNLITALNEPEKVVALSELNNPDINKLLQFLLAVTGLDSSFSLEEALRDNESFIELLKTRESLAHTAKFREDLVKYMGKTPRSRCEDQVTLSIYDYLTALVERIEITKMLAPKSAKIEELKSEIINNNVSITYAQKYILDVERELKQYLDQERRFSSELQKRKQPLKTSEITHIRTENLILAINDLNKSLQDKLDGIEKLEKNLIGDSYILACNLAYLGVLNVAQRAEVRGALSNILETNEISTDEAWQDQYLNSHKVAMKKILKALKIEKVTSGNLEDLDAFEGIFAHYFSKNVSIFIDEHHELQDLIHKSYTKEKTIHVLCSLYNISSTVEEALQHESQIFLEDFSEPYPETDLKGWKIGPGLTTDHPVLGHLWENNLSCTTNPTKFKDVCVFNSRFPLSLSPFYWSSSIFMYNNSIGEEKALRRIKQILINHLMPETAEKLKSLKENFDKTKKDYKDVSLRKKLELTQLDMDSLQSYENFIDLLEIIKVSNQTKEIFEEAKEALDNLMSESQSLSTFSYVIYLLYISLKQVGRLIGDVTYSWSSYLKIISMISSKTFRDVNLNKSETEAKPLSIDEDFYSRELLPNVWSVIKSGVPQENLALLSLIFSLNVAVMRETITLDNFDVFGQLFMQDAEVCTWMSSFDRSPVDGNFEDNFRALRELLLTWFPDTDDCLNEISTKLESFNFSKLEVGNVFKSVLLSPQFKQLPIFAKILIAAHHPDSTLKALLRQFIFEQLNSIFEYQEDYFKLNHFIKSASWSVPITLHSWPGINIVNIICSLANYYGVGLEVIRTDPELDENSKSETIETLELIEKCAEEGTWVLISTTKFPSFWKKTVDMLNQMRDKQEISNTFRLYIDVQGLKHYEIPDHFLARESIRFYMSFQNTEDLEGFEDVWSNILLEKVLKEEIIEKEQVSSVFIENSELKNF